MNQDLSYKFRVFAFLYFAIAYYKDVPKFNDWIANIFLLELTVESVYRMVQSWKQKKESEECLKK